MIDKSTPAKNLNNRTYYRFDKKNYNSNCSFEFLKNILISITFVLINNTRSKKIQVLINLKSEINALIIQIY